MTLKGIGTNEQFWGGRVFRNITPFSSISVLLTRH